MAQSDKPASEIAVELGIRRNQLYKWKEQFPSIEPVYLWIASNSTRLAECWKASQSPAPDRLKRHFYRKEKNQAWVSDTTFIRTRHDSAVAESFFGTLKTEWIDYEYYRTRAEAKQSLLEYIEVFYHRQRRHFYLDYLSPIEYEQANAL
jgi:transposase InsO family protein